MPDYAVRTSTSDSVLRHSKYSTKEIRRRGGGGLVVSVSSYEAADPGSFLEVAIFPG